jgi:hypothetical protein
VAQCTSLKGYHSGYYASLSFARPRPPVIASWEMRSRAGRAGGSSRRPRHGSASARPPPSLAPARQPLGGTCAHARRSCPPRSPGGRAGGSGRRLPILVKGSGGGLRRQLSVATRRELIEAVATRYRAADREGKTKILDEFVKVTGFHRKHAIRGTQRSTMCHSDRCEPQVRCLAPWPSLLTDN